MRTIKLNQEEAINEAKINCIRQFEKSFDVTVDDEKFLNSEAIWLVRTNKSIQCTCGETQAVEATLLTSYLTTEMPEDEQPAEELQFSSLVGICENCGE